MKGPRILRLDFICCRCRHGFVAEKHLNNGFIPSSEKPLSQKIDCPRCKLHLIVRIYSFEDVLPSGYFRGLELIDST